MSTLRAGPNVKLAKIFYKYEDRPKKTEEPVVQKEVVKDEETKIESEPIQSYPPYNFSWFVEGKIAGMGCPQTAENLNYLADVGINHIITLSPERIPPLLQCEKKMKWTEIRIKEFAAPTLKQIIKFIEICKRAEMMGEVIAVHCRHGRGRTGTMLACYLVFFQNMAPERAVLTTRLRRPGSCETYEQEKIVCHYHDCLRGTITKPDYRLVDDKLYFDYTMKYTYDNSDEETDDIEEEIDEKKTLKERVDEAILKAKPKTNAMVINHKIYF
ncbi:dual specificity protein phosphatase 23-like [Colias croceus]|uniref:dual specificity protein phosphatase 23-like n=1 Tax=Colias crocea TaxID=72248 RepID=UPI001E279E78|nr:dual specificity protein phosphatase 23-like [Colias croceus]